MNETLSCTREKLAPRVFPPFIRSRVLPLRLPRHSLSICQSFQAIVDDRTPVDYSSELPRARARARALYLASPLTSCKSRISVNSPGSGRADKDGFDDGYSSEFLAIRPQAAATLKWSESRRVQGALNSVSAILTTR